MGFFQFVKNRISTGVLRIAAIPRARSFWMCVHPRSTGRVIFPAA